jgi:nitrate/nitrite-specific signal transduction histidine kinase
MADLIGGQLSVSSKAGVGTSVKMAFPSQQNVDVMLTANQRNYG